MDYYYEVMDNFDQKIKTRKSKCYPKWLLAKQVYDISKLMHFKIIFTELLKRNYLPL